MKIERAYGLFETKSVSDSDQRIISGVASTPSLDRHGDMLKMSGARFATKIPLLWQHNQNAPIGEAALKLSGDRIDFDAKIADVEEDGELKRFLAKAWQSIKSRLVKGVSIAFVPKKYNYIEGGGVEHVEFEIIELSVVTIPANRDATIATVKSIYNASSDNPIGAIPLIAAPEPRKLVSAEKSVETYVKLLNLR